MSRIAIVFWSGTGNTAQMAQAISAGALLVADPVIAHEAPDENALYECRALGRSLI